MKRSFLLATLLSLTLSSCAWLHERRAERRFDPRTPQVFLVGNYLAVSPEPLIFLKDQRDVTITWQLPRGTKLRFPRDGIVFERKADGEIVNCAPRNEGLEFSCLNRHTRPGKYQYEITVTDGQKQIKVDPYVMNE
jgi:hypothetical protein